MELLITDKYLKTFTDGKNVKEGIKYKDPTNDEELMTFLFANALREDPSLINHKRLVHPDFDHNINNSRIVLEGQPIPPRGGTKGDSESNTKLDLSLGNIKRRQNTDLGIEFDQSDDSWVCFVEAKYYSDISTKTEKDPFRNQMARVIENLATFQSNNAFPEHIYFTLLVPRVFLNHFNSRLYGYKFKEYSNDVSKLIQDIQLARVPRRNEKDWKYPQDIEFRLRKLKFNLCSYEDLLSSFFKIDHLDITNKDHIESIRKIIPDLKFTMSSVTKDNSTLNDNFKIIVR